MTDDYVERITKFLTSHGINAFHFEHLAKHRVVIIPHMGRTNRIVFPATGSDWRGSANTVSDIRHVLGLFKTNTFTERRIRKPHRAKTACGRDRKISTPSFIEQTSPAPDKFFGPLMVLKAWLEAAANPTVEQVPADTPVTASATKPTRVALKTPWLGRHTRYALI
jgi:hypothetical protein